MDRPQVTTIGSSLRREVTLDKNPDSCPICHRGMTIKGSYYIHLSDHLLEGLYQCANLACHHLFIARFRYAGTYGLPNFNYVESVPFKPTLTVIDASLAKISPEY